ncbi:hypothetical protein PTTG_26293 [Puccinia triticina 1-1 BBBD Race 1]|uniref:Uncharacterized protein n=1 Tax=Puccinia triticina (isolate 1-1 / race 1 (BBBD)) TaxID=630390 RepID=A0A180GVX6_PUCT1|nr:hypothetical protein PTTG_26293 [Puccinia triticina 1-1 BBBD Race 1]
MSSIQSSSQPRRNLALPKQFEQPQSSNCVRRKHACIRPSSIKAQRMRMSTRASGCQQDIILSLISPRVALSPCLSSPSKVNYSISRLESGGCAKILQKVQSRPVASEQQEQVEKIMSIKTEEKAYILSPSWCTPNIHNAASKYHVSRSSKTHQADRDFLSVFLNNNGGYLDDSDDEEDEEEDDDQPAVNSFRATAAFLRGIPSAFQTRASSATGDSSSSSNLSSSASSMRTSADSSPSFAPLSRHQYYWERVQPTQPVTPPRTRSRFIFFKKKTT